MPVLTSKLNPRSEVFRASADQMRALVDDLNAKLATIAQGGGEAARAKHSARGKLPPRERVEMLLDPDTPFLELAPLAALDLYDNAAPGAGIITGIGRVSGWSACWTPTRRSWKSRRWPRWACTPRRTAAMRRPAPA